MIARRAFILSGTALLAAPWAARATPAEVAAAIKEVTDGAALKPGRVKLDIPVMVENGNAVGVTVGVAQEEPRCTDLYLFAEGNPLPRVLHASFGPVAGRTELATRMRLATSQTVVAVARLEDGSFWTDSVDLIVTLAACLE
ncbi:MAG: sulfur oxidation protein SoxY [Acetobacteraceae bacterium]|nr:sulfur oxidation protein SoxY [Acetobacteraceae bacterium]